MVIGAGSQSRSSGDIVFLHKEGLNYITAGKVVGFGVVITYRHGISLYWQELSVLAQKKTSTYRLTRVAARLMRMHLLVSHLFSLNRALPTRILKLDDPYDQGEDNLIAIRS